MGWGWVGMAGGGMGGRCVQDWRHHRQHERSNCTPTFPLLSCANGALFSVVCFSFSIYPTSVAESFLFFSLSSLVIPSQTLRGRPSHFVQTSVYRRHAKDTKSEVTKVKGNEGKGNEAYVTKAKVTMVNVTKAKVTKVNVTKGKATKAMVIEVYVA